MEKSILCSDKLDLLCCPVCESKTKRSYISKYRGKSELFNKNKLYQCSECEIIFINPLPTPTELDQYYKTNWLKDEDIVSVSREMEMIYRIQGKERCNYLIKHRVLREGAKILDIGSGYGYMFKAIQSENFKKLEFFATDPSPISLEKLRTLGVKAYDSFKEIPDKNFDLVTLGQVLEHIPNPISYLKSIIELVKDGGYIYIDVPDRDDTHKALFEPHVLFYSKESLLNLGKNLNLQVVHVTGFGARRKNFIFPKNIFHRIICLASSRFRAILNSESENEQLRKRLFDTYLFDREGDERWWVRIIFKVV